MSNEYENVDIGIWALQAWAVMLLAGVVCGPFGSPPSFLEALYATGLLKFTWWFANREV